MILFDILQVIDDIEEIEIFQSYKHNDDFCFKGTKREFENKNDLIPYKSKEVKGIYPTIDCKLHIIIK